MERGLILLILIFNTFMLRGIYIRTSAAEPFFYIFMYGPCIYIISPVKNGGLKVGLSLIATCFLL
jgi:hypothetical protein